MDSGIGTTAHVTEKSRLCIHARLCISNMNGKNEFGSIGVLREPPAERLAGTTDLDDQRGLAAKELALDEGVHDVLGVVRHG